MSLRRLPIRLRLSLLYGTLVFVCGAVLMAVAYTIVEHNLTIYSQRVASARPRPLLFPDPTRPGARRKLDAFVRRQNEALLARALRRQAAIEQTARVDARDRVALEFLAALLGLSIPSALVGYLLAGRALRPVEAITMAAQRAAGGDLSGRLALPGPRDELSRLADTFDVMLERLDGAFARQQAFVANASHELRTPLAIVRAELDATLTDPTSGAEELRSMARTISEATARSERLIERLLVLAQSERAALARRDVDLDRLVERIVAELGAEARARRVLVSLGLGGAAARGDEVLLASLVRNVVENAIRHNRRGGAVAIATARRGHEVVLAVANDGAPIAPERVVDLFEPFLRLERTARAGRGSGLGLAIVKAVAVAHGGEVRAAARAAGGLEVTVLLPEGGREARFPPAITSAPT